MFCVYILESIRSPGKTYVGLSTKLPKTRLDEHNNGGSKFTKAFVPWKLIYYEKFYCKLCADKRETFLKSGVGFKLRRLIVKYQHELK